MIVDYLHSRKFPILGPIATWTLRTATVGVLVGVYQFNTNDIGAINIRCHLSSSNLDSYRLVRVDCEGLDCIRFSCHSVHSQFMGVSSRWMPLYTYS